VRIPPRLDAFAQEVMPVIVGTKRTDGTVQLTPVWFECADGVIWLNGAETRDWLRHARRDGTVTLLLIDPKNMWRYAQLIGRFTDVVADDGGVHIDRLGHRYRGAAYRGPKTGRVKIRFEPDRITGGEGGRPWTEEPTDTG
jgi:PPOX class probable F420-dependent enzyme